MDLTFDLLATTPNEAAERLLSLALRSEDRDVRRLGIQAGLRRRSRQTALEVLKIWDDLTDAELCTVQDSASAMQPVVSEVLASSDDSLWLVALDAVRMLSLDPLLPLVIDRLETCADRRLRTRLLATVLDLASSLGEAARNGRERPSARGPIVSRLADSVRGFHRHRCQGLCDAFLAASCWGDQCLRMALAEDPQMARLLSGTLMHSVLPGVIHLLAGFIRRHNIPAVAQQAIEQRDDEAFRDSLLAVVGDNPSRLTIRNVAYSRPLACLGGYPTLAARTPARHYPAMLHVHTVNTADPLAQLTVILDVISRGSRRVDAAAIASLGRLAPIDPVAMIRAAMAVADLDMETIQRDALAQLVWRMVNLLDHPDEAVVAALRQVMRPLHAESFITLVDQVTVYHPARLGRLLRRIDPAAMDFLRDELRNPVLARRCRAIHAAVACNGVDVLIDLVIHAALHDHRQARVIAIGALAVSDLEDSLATLERLAAGPDSPERDAARDALEKRRSGASPTAPLGRSAAAAIVASPAASTPVSTPR